MTAPGVVYVFLPPPQTEIREPVSEIWKPVKLRWLLLNFGHLELIRRDDTVACGGFDGQDQVSRRKDMG